MQLSLMYFINKNIRNLFVLFMIMVSLTALCVKYLMPTIINVAFAPFNLDYISAFDEKNLVALSGLSVEESAKQQLEILKDAQNGKIDEKQIQKLSDYLKKSREYNVEAQEMFNYSNVYMQDNKYKFILKPKEVYDIDLSYETTYTIRVDGVKSSSSDPVNTHKYILLDTGNTYVLTKVAPDFEVKPGQIFQGVFLPLSSILVEDFQKVLGEGNQINNLFTYEFDTVTSFSNYEGVDLAWLVMLSILTIFMGIKLVIYKIEYIRHPTYKQLSKLYGNEQENEASINLELADEGNVKVYRNTYMTENWEIKKGIFKTKISMLMKNSRFDS